MKIIFMGNPEFAVPSLQQLIRSNHQIISVVTGADKRRGRGKDRLPSPVKNVAIQAGLPLLESDDVNNPEFINRLRELKPDLLVVVAFKILCSEILAIPKFGSVNLHASLLPKYRGAAPIHRALINGENQTGCTVFLLDSGMDTGLILNQKVEPIDLLDTTGDVYERLKWSGSELLLNTVNDISVGRQTEIKQNNQVASNAPKITAEDARIDFQKDCMIVHNLIRGMSPFPGAWTLYDTLKTKIYRSRPDPLKQIAAGEVQLIDDVCFVGCDTGCIELIEAQLEGRKKMSGIDFYNGLKGRIFLK